MDHEESNEESNNEPSNLANCINCSPKLVCIQYPGIVNNIDKALATLGGIQDIEIATCNVKTNLELRFRPKDLYCKPTIADRDRKPNLLVKVKIGKTIKDGKVIEKKVIDYNLVGISALTFKFNKLCDFQYLPLIPKEPQEKEVDEVDFVYNKIIPDDIPPADWFTSEEAETMPYYFPPSSFSKFNSSNNQLYFDRSKFYEGRFTPEYYQKFKEQEIQQKIYRKDKGKSLSQGGFFCNFDDDIPLTPPQTAIDALSVKYTSQGSLGKIQKCFEERPIWSKQALLYTTGISLEQMKYLLPTVAYYYVGGPWRIMWVKFGYDPRKEPSSRIYQCFDYRVRATGFKLKVKPKRSYTKGTTYGKTGNRFSLKDDYHSSTTLAIQENAFLLKPGMIPSARQMFYQYCDVELSEVKAMLSRLPPVIPGTKCHKKNGWLPSGFTEQCREIANKYIGAQVKKELREEKEDAEGDEADDNIENKETGQSEQDEFLEISDSSGDSSESEDESNVTKIRDEYSDNEIDMETVEEVNRIIDLSTKSSSTIDVLAQPGPSSRP